MSAWVRQRDAHIWCFCPLTTGILHFYRHLVLSDLMHFVRYCIQSLPEQDKYVELWFRGHAQIWCYSSAFALWHWLWPALLALAALLTAGHKNACLGNNAWSPYLGIALFGHWADSEWKQAIWIHVFNASQRQDLLNSRTFSTASIIFAAFRFLLTFSLSI